ncbi:MAG: hypothetical protein AAF806_31840, partial [Bacteroidota bacterium]
KLRYSVFLVQDSLLRFFSKSTINQVKFMTSLFTCLTSFLSKRATPIANFYEIKISNWSTKVPTTSTTWINMSNLFDQKSNGNYGGDSAALEMK